MKIYFVSVKSNWQAADTQTGGQNKTKNKKTATNEKKHTQTDKTTIWSIVKHFPRGRSSIKVIRDFNKP